MENEIKENKLELIITEKTLGSLTTNAIQIRDLVRSNLSKYDISNYNDDNIDQAKKDKAALNKAAKSLNSKRIEIEKEFMKPFGEFKEIISETVKLIGECSSKIDNVVKQNEQQYKGTKLSSIKCYFDENNVNEIDFDKMFKQEWLNKSTSLKSVCNEIDKRFKEIESDLLKFSSDKEDSTALVTYYKGCLNKYATLEYSISLKGQRERARRIEEERLKREAEEKAKQASCISTQNIELPKEDPNKEEKKNDPFKKYSETPIKPALFTRAFKVTTTRENIILLGDFMNEHGIDFDKIELK